MLELVFRLGIPALPGYLKVALTAVLWGTWNYECDKTIKCEGRMPDTSTDRREAWNSKVDY